MGFDNECVVDIQSLPGEYFCPVCRTLIYPNESLQAQCTHLYCKPCLAYVVATTHACPYDGYLVTEADAKPLIESNKELSESIGKVFVHCLYHRSGCQWQGTLAECTTHCTGCSYGNSPVVCNRCGTQIVHSQVQEHAQICPGVQPQTQQVENVQPQAVAVPNQAAAQDPVATASTAAPLTAAAPTTTAVAAAAASAAILAPAVVPSAAAAGAPVQTQVQGGVAVYPQPPSAEHWYQQQQLQYQQYYQQYPGYDPYQQQYQQYAQYQQQAHPQYMQPQMQAAQQVVPGQQQPQLYMHPQPQSQPQPQPHAQPLPPQQTKPQVAPPQQQQQQQLPLQPHQQPRPQTQLQPHQHPQPHMQAQIPQMQVQPHVPALQPSPHGQIAGQPHPQSHQLHPLPQPQARPPQLPGPPQQQQAVPPQQQQAVPLQHHPPAQMPYPQSHPQQQLRPQHPPPQNQQLAMQSQQHPQPHLQTVPLTQTSHPPSLAVSGHHSYPQPVAGAPQPRPMQMHTVQASMPPPYQQSRHPPQLQDQCPPQQPPQMRPPHAQMPIQVQQQPAMAPPQLPPANLHPGQQQVQQPMHQAGMQPHAPQHGFPHSQAQGHLHPGQMQQQGVVPPQQLYPQQPFRPQGPAYMQHQTQARPVVPNQGVPQQPFQQSHAGGTELIQPGQSPNNVYPGRSTSQMPQLSELQLSQVPHSGNQVHVSLATPLQGTSLPENSGPLAQSESGMTIKAAKGAESAENIPDPKSTGKEDKLTMGAKEKGAAENDSKEYPESEKGHESLGTKQNVDGKMINQVKGKEEEVTETSNEETKGHDQRPNEKSIAQVGEVAHPMQDGSSNVHSHAGADIQRPNPDNMQTQQMPAPGGLARGQSVLPAVQTTLPAQERGIPQTGYHDRNASQFPQQYPPARGPVPNHERFPPQQVPYGYPPNMTDPTIISQRPPAPDRMFPQPMQVHGPMNPPTQTRPSLPGHNQMESFPQQGQTTLAPEPFWPTPHAGGPGPGLPPPPAGVPLHHVFQHNTFHQQSLLPAGQSQTHMPPPNAGGARGAPGEPFTRSDMVGPPPGALEAPSRMPGGGVGQSPLVNPMEQESYTIRRPGVHDSRQPEPHRPLPDEHASYRQPGALKMNGMPNKAYIGGMHDSTFGPGVGEDRFRSLPEERFKPFPEEGFNTPQDRFRPSTLDPGRHVNRREFEEDLKQFTRPAYLNEGSKFDGYMSDRAPHVSGGSNLITSRPLPSYQSGSPFPPRSEGEMDRPMLHEGMGRKHDTTVADHLNATSEFGRHRLDGLPPVRSPGREYDGFSSTNFGLRGQSHREDFEERDLHGFAPRFKSSNFPPPGPAYFGKDIPDGSGSLHSNQLRGLDGPDIPNIHPHAGGAPGHGFGVSGSFSGIGEHGRPGSLPSHMRFGESGGFNGYLNSVSREGEVDSFEQSKRKPGSMGWCRICKIDCMTVEGLDLHSQTREHQNMTMDLVLSIKQDNAKKHKLNSEKAISFEDENRSRKANFENRRKRQ